MAFLFLDTETTGTEDYDQVVEVAYAIDDGPIKVNVIEHTRCPTNWVFENIGYFKRIVPATKVTIVDWVLSLHDDWRKLCRDENLYLVCANPAFDARLLKQSLGSARISFPWHFRMVDIETLVMGKFSLLEPPSLSKCGELLGVPANQNKHTAEGDVEHLRACFQKCTSMS